MKLFLMALCLALTVTTSALAAESDSTGANLCENWQIYSSGDRIRFILGWLTAVEAADTMTGDEIISKLWPAGHRVGGVVIEMSVECGKSSNRNTALGTLMVRIAKRLNGVGGL